MGMLFQISSNQRPRTIVHTQVYLWDVRDDSAGSTAEFSSKMWLYHSHIHETKDSNTGLVGPIIITKPGYARDEVDNLMPYDVDREFVTLFTVMNENEGWYLEKNFLKDEKFN